MGNNIINRVIVNPAFVSDIVDNVALIGFTDSGKLYEWSKSDLAEKGLDYRGAKFYYDIHIVKKGNNLSLFTNIVPINGVIDTENYQKLP